MVLLIIIYYALVLFIVICLYGVQKLCILFLSILSFYTFRVFSLKNKVVSFEFISTFLIVVFMSILLVSANDLIYFYIIIEAQIISYVFYGSFT